MFTKILLTFYIEQASINTIYYNIETLQSKTLSICFFIFSYIHLSMYIIFLLNIMFL